MNFYIWIFPGSLYPAKREGAERSCKLSVRRLTMKAVSNRVMS
jgi:hypothetical protein